ncbi:MAG: hypothetical protein DI529_03425 [Chryseobacterium sp.]|nr:MAG: hypothetical protein DI529_03425 [Chryseobacterium sp.]
MNQNRLNHGQIPKSVKIFTIILLVAGSFFCYVYTFNPGLSFSHATLDTYSARVGFESAGVRILGSLVALAISLVANNPRWLFISLISRIVIELGDVVIGLVNDGITANTFALLMLAGAEIWAVLKLWAVIRIKP